jgi:S-disulfanyl-L-cysteine oxidoreductase SoxD
MRSRDALVILGVMLVVGACATPGTTRRQDRPERPRAGFGQPITEVDVAAWNIDVRTSDGRGLPPGRGTVAQGKAVYDAKCLACHGPDAKGGSMYGAMVGGIGSFKTSTRVVTPGSMYPYAPILFDYVRRAMPMDRPLTMTDDEVYAVAAYLLHLNGLVPADAVIDAESLPKVRMPNRDGFIVDDRPDTRAVRCMRDCK